MLNGLMDLARPLLFTLGGEQAHEATLRALEAGIYPRWENDVHDSLRTSLWGLSFPNPIGIAAGFDKNARVPDAVLGMGLGFTEIGTVTPLPQDGNPKPRVFRLIAERGMINRLGFNNAGHAAALARLRSRAQSMSQSGGRGGSQTSAATGIVGVNIGANKTTDDRIADYVAGLRTFNDVASYFMVNISSPNTPGLRDLQGPAALDELLGRLLTARRELVASGKPERPVIVKIAPDIAEDDLPAIIEKLVDHNVDGIAVSNTTLTRPGLSACDRAHEAGGLSGRPLFHRSTVILARVYKLSGGRIPLIGIGGIDSGETALAKIKAGATLLQLYTGLVYGGGALIRDMHEHLARHVADTGLATISEATGSDAQTWADKPLDG